MYINSLATDHRLRARQNVYAFSLACASLEILQWLSMSVAPLDIGDPGAWNFHFVTGNMDQSSISCQPGCLQVQQVGDGDCARLAAPTANHPIAEATRAERARAQRRTGTRALAGLVGQYRRVEGVCARALVRAAEHSRLVPVASLLARE